MAISGFRVASRLIGLQLVTRLLGTLLNTAVIRKCGPEILGFASFRFELFLTTVISLSRDGLRVALLRFVPPPQDKPEHYQGWVWNLFVISWLAIPLSIPIALLIGCISYCLSFDDPALVGLGPYALQLLLLYWVVAAIDLFAEPFALYFLHTANDERSPAIRFRIETSSALLKSMVTWTLLSKGDVANDGFRVGAWSFFLGSLSGSIARLALSLYYFRPNLLVAARIDRPTVLHGLAMSKQIGLRYMLAQGDMHLVAFLCSLPEQAVYAVASNYGSLFCRLLLQPLEETTLQLYSTEKHQQHEFLATALKLEVLLGLMAMAFGPPNAGWTVKLLLGNRWSQATGTSSLASVLTAYCFLVLPMALSGILEAYTTARLPQSKLPWMQKMVFLVTLAYLCLSALLMRAFGAVGLVLANIFNFAARLALSLIADRDMGRSLAPLWAKAIPSKSTLCLLAACSAVNWIAAVRAGVPFRAVIGVSSGIMFLAALLFTERALVRSIRKESRSTVAKED